MSTDLARRVGAVARVTKQLSEADVALFVLVTDDAPLEGEEPPDPARRERQEAPLSLLAALLSSAAAHHAVHPELAHFVSQTVRFHEQALTDDTVTATAEVVGYDPKDHALQIQVRAENQEGRRLAEGQVLLRDD